MTSRTRRGFLKQAVLGTGAFLASPHSSVLGAVHMANLAYLYKQRVTLEMAKSFTLEF
jgi:hypothetical protein